MSLALVRPEWEAMRWMLSPDPYTNMNSFVGLAYISGMVTQTNTKTGATARFPFRDSDMRFMEGNSGHGWNGQPRLPASPLRLRRSAIGVVFFL